MAAPDSLSSDVTARCCQLASAGTHWKLSADLLVTVMLDYTPLYKLECTIRSIVCEASCHPVTRSLGHLVTWSLGHFVTLSLGHLVTCSVVTNLFFELIRISNLIRNLEIFWIRIRILFVVRKFSNPNPNIRDSGKKIRIRIRIWRNILVIQINE